MLLFKRETCLDKQIFENYNSIENKTTSSTKTPCWRHFMWGCERVAQRFNSSTYNPINTAFWGIFCFDIITFARKTALVAFKLTASTLQRQYCYSLNQMRMNVIDNYSELRSWKTRISEVQLSFLYNLNTKYRTELVWFLFDMTRPKYLTLIFDI